MYITYADALRFLTEAVEERGEDYVNVMYKDAGVWIPASTACLPRVSRRVVSVWC